MSEKLGTVSLDQSVQPTFLKPNESHSPPNYSEHTAEEIDKEVRRLIEEQGVKVKALLSSLEEILVKGAEKLLKEEVMTGQDLQALLPTQPAPQEIHG